MPMAKFASKIALLDIDKAEVKDKVLIVDEDGNWDDKSIMVDDKGDTLTRITQTCVHTYSACTFVSALLITSGT
jgi:hypothetical protein